MTGICNKLHSRPLLQMTSLFGFKDLDISNLLEFTIYEFVNNNVLHLILVSLFVCKMREMVNSINIRIFLNFEDVLILFLSLFHWNDNSGCVLVRID